MRITERQLRRIVRQEILRENDAPPPKTGTAELGISEEVLKKLTPYFNKLGANSADTKKALYDALDLDGDNKRESARTNPVLADLFIKVLDDPSLLAVIRSMQGVISNEKKKANSGESS